MGLVIVMNSGRNKPLHVELFYDVVQACQKLILGSAGLGKLSVEVVSNAIEKRIAISD